jgi:hypothetical protein
MSAAPPRLLIPREHGTYGELLFPLVTAFGAGGISVAGAAVAVAAVLGYLAHESFAVLAGLRGPRARRERGAIARRSLGWLGGAAASAGVVGLALAPTEVRVALLASTLLSLAVMALAWAGHERTTMGEVGVALALASWSVPVALAGGATWVTSLACAAIWSVIFAAGTFAVRAVIARTRRESVRSSVIGSVGVSLGAVVCAAWLVRLDILPAGVLWALLPTTLVVFGLCVPGVTAQQLRRVGWTLVSASAMTLVALLLVFA